MELTPYLSWTSRAFMCASATSLAETPPSIVWTSRYKGMLASFAVGLGKSTTWSCARPEGRRGGPPSVSPSHAALGEVVDPDAVAEASAGSRQVGADRDIALPEDRDNVEHDAARPDDRDGQEVPAHVPRRCEVQRGDREDAGDHVDRRGPGLS